MPSVAALIRDSSGAILLQQKSDGSWSLPAGAIEPGESPCEALKREVLEETGMTIDHSQVVGVFGGADFRYIYPNGDQVEYTVVLYECTASKVGAHSLDSETVSLQYFNKDQFPGLSLPYPQQLLFPDQAD